jgi:predicted dienelactone hydrolase
VCSSRATRTHAKVARSTDQKCDRFNPLVGQLFGKTGIAQVATPVLMLAGTEDTITPALNNQLQPFNQLRSSKYLLTAIGGTHLSIGDPGNLGITPNQSSVKERRGEETKPLRQLVQGVSLAFIEQLTSEAKTYQPFLTPAYAQSFSKPELAVASEYRTTSKYYWRWLKWEALIVEGDRSSCNLHLYSYTSRR